MKQTLSKGMGRYGQYFWVRILIKVILLGATKTEIMFMIFLASNIVELILLDFLEAILTSICLVSGYFMFMYRFV